MASTARQRWTVHYAGHVQGVGFRYRTTTIASQLEITGYVRNLADGRVELVAEGAANELRALVDGIKEQLGAYIRQTEVDRSGSTGEFGGFEVRH